jgi:hypothetical protein
VLPVSILLLAGAIWLLELGAEHGDEAPAEPKSPPPPSDH